MEKIKLAVNSITFRRQYKSLTKLNGVLISQLAEHLKWDQADLMQNIPRYSWSDLSKDRRKSKKLEQAKDCFREIVKIEKSITMIRMGQQASIILSILIFAVTLQILYPRLTDGVRTDFYAATAQIFPIVLVAIYLSNRSDEPDYYKIHQFTREKFFGFTATFIGLIGSLGALASGHSTTTSFIFVVAGLVISFIVMFVAAVKN